MKKLTCIFFIALLSQVTVNSQQANPGLEIARQQFQAKQVIPPSPEAASLGKYGNVPVSLFTGTPNVSIPLVELKGNFLSLPVSLSYNSSGFKPDEIAPWTGLGWALNAGGVITRSVMGDPDMDNNYFKTPSPLREVPADELEKQFYYESIRNKQTETQTDVYYYNFMGHTGKFMINPDSTLIKKEKSYLDIVRWMGPESEWIFIIIDEQGFRYEFMSLERTQINPTDDEPNAPPMIVRNFVSSWYLTKVIAPNGKEELEFEYYSPAQAQATMSGALTNNSVTYSLAELDYVPADPIGVQWAFQPPSNSMYTFHSPATSIWKKFIKKVILRKNNIAIGYIDFESELNARTDLGDADFDGERRLKNVKLYNVTNSDTSLVQQFTLGYENFGNHQAEAPGYYRRLKLKTVRELSVDSTITPSKPPHIFYYNNEYEDMPMRFTSGLDHWGFYNGAYNFHGPYPTLIPTVNVIAEYIGGSRGLGANREPNALNAQFTVLRKIEYPTGGYTSFEYEGNTASIFNNGQANIPVGGVRMREMVDHSFPDKPAVAKRYEYKNENDSTSGIIAYYPYYYTLSEWVNDKFCPVPYPPTTSIVIKTYNVTISASSGFGLGSIQGSHIGYERVTEYQVDLATGRSLGKTAYNYDILSFNEIDNHIGNGDLIKQQVFDNGNQLLEETINSYTYEDFLSERAVNRKLLSLQYQTNSNILMQKIAGGDTSYMYYPFGACFDPQPGYIMQWNVPTQSYHLENYIPQQRKKMNQQVRKVFDPPTNTYLTYTKTFTYGNPEHVYPTLIEETDSRNDIVGTSIKYVADYVLSCSPAAPPGSMAHAIGQMKNKNMWGIPVEKLQYRESYEGGNRRYVSGEVIQYNRGLPEKIYHLRAHPLPASVTESQASCSTATQSIDNKYQLVATLTYDSLMNLVEEQKTNDLVTTYFWGYNNRYPVAKLTGKTHTEALTSGISQAVLDNPSSESALRTELHKLRMLSGALVTSHTYQPMVGMISATDPRGQLLTYEYDKLNRLLHIRDSHAIIKNYRYGYGLGTAPATSVKSIYYNAPVQDTFTKAGCPPGQHGEVMIYQVPYGKHAAISQYKADSMAAADIAANGQNYANSHGQCFWHNEEESEFLFKNDCPPEQGPPIAVLYTVPAGKHKSLISQQHADSLATAEITALGQAYANANGTCSCVGVGKKWINDFCETGTIIWLGGYYDNGEWECVYYYEFSDSSISGYYYVRQPFPCPSGS